MGMADPKDYLDRRYENADNAEGRAGLAVSRHNLTPHERAGEPGTGAGAVEDSGGRW
jgi:hypothetical protein